MIRMALALVVCCVAIAAAAPAHAQNTEQPPTMATPPEAAPAPPAPPQNGLGTRPPAPAAESKPPESPAAESRSPETPEGRYTFSRVQDGYVRLNNRTGQVSFCSKRTVGWTCQLAPEDRAAFESEIARLQEENVALKKDLLGRGLPLPGSIKAEEPPVARNDRLPAPSSDPNFDRMKEFVEQVWRRLVALIVSLQKDVLKKS